MTIIYIDKIQNATPEAIIEGKDVSDTMLVDLPFDINPIYLKGRVALDTEEKKIYKYDREGQVENIIDISGENLAELTEQFLALKQTVNAHSTTLVEINDDVEEAQSKADSAHNIAVSAQSEAAVNTAAIATNTAVTAKNSTELTSHALQLKEIETQQAIDKSKIHSTSLTADEALQKSTRLDGEMVVERGRIDKNTGDVASLVVATEQQSEQITLLKNVDTEQQELLNVVVDEVEKNTSSTKLLQEGQATQDESINSLATSVESVSSDLSLLQDEVTAIDLSNMLKQNENIRVEDITSSGSFNVGSSQRVVKNYDFKIDSASVLKIDPSSVDVFNRQLKGLQDGTQPTDAATKKQLDEIDAKVTQGSGLKPSGDHWDMLNLKVQNIKDLVVQNNGGLTSDKGYFRFAGDALLGSMPIYDFKDSASRSYIQMTPSGIKFPSFVIAELLSALGNTKSAAANLEDVYSQVNKLKDELEPRFRVIAEGELTWNYSPDLHINTMRLCEAMPDHTLYIGVHAHNGESRQKIVAKGSSSNPVTVSGTFLIFKHKLHRTAGIFITNEGNGSSWLRTLNVEKGWWFSVSTNNSRSIVSSIDDLDKDEAQNGFFYVTERDGVVTYNEEEDRFITSNTYDLPEINNKIQYLEEDNELSKPVTHYFTGETRLSYDFPNPNSTPADIQLFVLDTTQHIEASHIDLTDTDQGIYTGRYNSIGSHCIHDGKWTANSGHNAYKHITNNYYVVFDKSRFKWLIIEPENPHTSNNEQAIKTEVILGDRSQLPESFSHYVIETNFTDLDSLEFLSAVAAHQIDTINKKIIFDFNGAKPSGFVIIK